ncbi:MAG: alpha-2-macroglobulin family protein [Candidatus Cyclobacteriaceae bacterium M3_2C_046]
MVKHIKYPTRFWLAALAAFILILTGVFYFSNQSNADQKIHTGTVDPAFSAYITYFSAGVVSSNDYIKIRFAQQMIDSARLAQPLSDKVLDFEPEIKGSTYWLDTRTIEFRPEKPLESGQGYKARLWLSKLMDVPDHLNRFDFYFQTIVQNYDLQLNALQTYDVNDLTRQKLEGIILTADFASPDQVQQILAAEQSGRSLPVSWHHDTQGRSHQFVIEEIQRTDHPGQVDVFLNGKSLEIDKEEKQQFEIPALGEFKLISARVVQSPDQYLSLHFSDPLLPDQTLDGMIQVEGLEDIRYIVTGHELQVFAPLRQTGNKAVIIHPGIQNILGYKLGEPMHTEVLYEQQKPALRLVGKGVVLPDSRGLIFPFEAVSLKAVDVKIIRIFEENIGQFLQVNDLEGNREIRRVGRPLIYKTLPLNTSGITDLGKWNRFTLDLSEIIQTEPGAIYQVILGFRQQHVVYSCPGSNEGENMDQMELLIENLDAENSDPGYWDDYDAYYYAPDFDWEQRDNPCNPSYFGSRRNVSRNVLASDLGLLAKAGQHGDLMLMVNDLKTTQPMAAVELEIYDYQHQLLSTVVTNEEGQATIKLDQKPFLVVARYNQQRGYLKLDDGASLSLSNFNVGGQKVQEGIKGFIYGERGVWRPGDSLHLTFLLEDKDQLIPTGHPVIFQLYNPQGQVTQKIVTANHTAGFYNFSTNTDLDDPTGNWRAEVRVGGAVFQKNLKIETIKPNRLKINLDFGKKRLTAAEDNITGNLTVKWLHGAPAKNLKAEFEVILSQTQTKFDDYPAYHFDDPARQFYSESQKVFEGYLDEQGQAGINTRLRVQNEAPGQLMAHFKGKVYEEGGNFSIDQFSVPYYPYSSFVGINLPRGDQANGMLFTDTTHFVSIVTVDAEGQPVSRQGIEMEVYKLDWRWWWDNSEVNVANYINGKYAKPIKKGVTNTRNGKGSWSFKVEQPEWGRFLIRACDPVSGHCTGQIIYLDWPGWAGRGQRAIPGAANMLTFSAEKEVYHVGQDVRINIPGSSRGRALVSLENGTKVMQTYWINTNQGENPFTFRATADMAPNIYVHVTLLQPHGQTVNDLPIRLFGIIPLEINDPATRLEPQINMPASLKPEMPVNIRVSEKNGKPMAYTLAMVDEGLLDLTRFKTPEPWQIFYAREALGVKTWDLYDQVMGAFGGELERLLAIGGDQELAAAGSKKASRFKPVVKYLGPFFLQEGQTDSHQFMMPAYIGSVRTMVIAGYQGTYGKAEKTTPVKQELMVLATLPRVLGPEEEVKLPVNLFIHDPSVKMVDIELKANNIFSVQGPSRQILNVEGMEDAFTSFDLKVKPLTGMGKVQVVARSGNITSTYTIDIEIRNPHPPVTKVQDDVMEAGESWEAAFQTLGMKGTNTAILEIAAIPPINLEKRLKFLLNYPHGCVEQTISTVFPQLYVSGIMDLSEEEKQKIEANVKTAIDQLIKFQVAQGGFAYWPGQLEPNQWGTNYAGHFLLEAEKKGYQIPAGLLNKWVRYQKRLINQWRPDKRYSDDLMQAYRLYTLALAQQPDLGAMNRMRETPNVSTAANWRLAAAYVLAGQPEAASKIISQLSYAVPDYRELSHTFGSTLRDKAMILETLNLLDQKMDGVVLAQEISSALSDPQRWMSTQETAYCLIAMTQFAGKDYARKGLRFTYQLNGQAAVRASTDLPLAQINLSDIDQSGSNQLMIENRSEGIHFARIIQQGTPVKPEPAAYENNLKLQVIYKNMDDELIEPAALAQGTNFMVEVTVSNPGLRGDYQELALTQIFPSGWEIINTRLDQAGNYYLKDQPEYQDIRDDRVLTYFDLPASQRKTFRILLNANYGGKFYLPAITCEAMYDQAISARKPGEWVNVLLPENL